MSGQYLIIEPQGRNAVRCDKLLEFGRPKPPEMHETLDQAIDRIPGLFEEVANHAFPWEMPLSPGAVTVKITLFNCVTEATKARIKREFKKHPSVPIVGHILFWNTHWDTITCLIQGKKEIEQYLNSKEAKELSKIAKCLDAKIVSTGIVIE